jgi:dihydrofolate reductase
MNKVIVFNHVTLDGVMQAPARPDEDRRGGFAHGGWARPRADADMAEAAGQRMRAVPALLLGRRTYEDLYSFWPNQPEPNPFTALLNQMQKYVASTTLEEPLAWSNSSLLKGDAADAVAGLKEHLDRDILVFGSGELIQSLMRRNLIDEFVLLIHPLVLGSGVRLFPDAGACAALRLVDAKPSPSGVVIATYQKEHVS